MNNLIFGVELITSKSNSTILEIAKLSEKKHRVAKKQFLCDGIKLFKEAKKFGANIRYIVLENEAKFDADIIEMVKECVENGAKVLCVADYVFKKITAENSPQGIVTICDFFAKNHLFSTNVKNGFFDNKRVLALESVRDPGNMGTICRNAVALGIDVLIISSDCADIYSPKVVRASMGAIFKLNILITDSLVDEISKIKESGRRVLAAALDKNALVLGKEKLSKADIVVLGNEGHGLSDAVVKECTNTILIPMRENTESLNVATAAAILMWEISK